MDRSDRVTRPLAVGDFDQLMRLGLEAFGALPAGTPPPSSEGLPCPQGLDALFGGRQVHIRDYF